MIDGTGKWNSNNPFGKDPYNMQNHTKASAGACQWNYQRAKMISDV